MKRETDDAQAFGEKEARAEAANRYTRKAGNVKRFLENTKARLKSLDADGWCVELGELYGLSVQYNLGLHKNDCDYHVHDDWVVQCSEPAVRVLEAGGEDCSLQRESVLKLSINLKTTNTDIVEGFKSALNDARKHVAAPVVKRGRQALNGSFDEGAFKKWRYFKIVELARLLAWREKLRSEDRKLYRDHVIGEWLGFGGEENEKEIKKKTSMAKRLLRQALASLPALRSQITRDKNLTVPLEVEMDWLLKNMTITRDAQGNPEISIPRQVIVAKAIDTRKRQS